MQLKQSIRRFFVALELFKTSFALVNNQRMSIASRRSEQEKLQRFVTWLDEVEECEGIGATEVRSSQTGLRGVYSKESFEANEYILGIPYVSCILVYENYFEEEEENEASDVEKAKLLLKVQQNETISDHWRPYFEILPTPSSNFAPTPDFWDANTIQQLEQVSPQWVQDTLALKKEFGGDEELQFATWLLRSRACSTYRLLSDNHSPKPGRILTRTLLIPYIDCINHGTEPNAQMQRLEAKSDDESFFALMATRPISPGDEITISYGTGAEICLDMVSKYGFWPLDTSNDQDYLAKSSIVWDTTIEEDENQQRATSDQSVRDMLSLRMHMKRTQSRLDENTQVTY